MEQRIDSPLMTDEDLDDTEEIKVSKHRLTQRRFGNYFDETDFRQTRADKIREVNKQLLPLVRVLFIYCYVMALCL